MKRRARTRGEAVAEGTRRARGAGPESEGRREVPEPAGIQTRRSGRDRTAGPERGSEGDKESRERGEIRGCGEEARALEEETREQRVVEVCEQRCACCLAQRSSRRVARGVSIQHILLAVGREKSESKILETCIASRLPT